MDRLAVVVPTLNEERSISHCVRGLLAQMPSDGHLYVADGGSTDRTQQLVRQLAQEDRRVILVQNPKRLQASAINLVARMVRGKSEILVRADAHNSYPANFLSSVVAAYEKERPASVVVRVNTQGRECFQKAAAAAQNSRLGNGGSPHRSATTGAGTIDHGRHALFNLSFFERLGGYDEMLRANEDAELDIRIAQAGGRIWMCPDAPVSYHPRATPASLAKQYFFYGVGRYQSARKHNRKLKARQRLPVIATFGIATSALAAVVWPWALALPAAYAAVCLVWGVKLAIDARDGCVLASGIAAMIMHLCWGAGYIAASTQAIFGLDRRRAAQSTG